MSSIPVSSCDKKTWGEDTAIGKAKNKQKKTCENSCVHIPETHAKTIISELTPRERETANTSRNNAISVLESCKKLFTHVTLKIDTGKLGVEEQQAWDQFYSQPGSKICCTDERYAVLTPERIDRELEVLKKIKFMKDENEKNAELYAYVYPHDPTYTVYLCKLFWEASDELAMDSKLGTLIHEASHFLKTEDSLIPEQQEKDVFVLTNIDHRGPQSGKESTFDVDCFVGEQGDSNANNWEYEFEIRLRHDGRYDGNKWSCCDVTQRFSVCYHKMHTFTPSVLTCTKPRNAKEVQLQTLRLIVDGVEHVTKY